MNKASKSGQLGDDDIAIVGMAVHVPGANSLDAYWHNLRNGINSIRKLDEKALLDAGESPEKLRQPNYVPAAAVLDDFDTFDAEFFGFSPKDAAILDPQHRQFLEVAWEALEIAGHPPETVPGKVGVYAGCGMGSYFYFNICSNPDLVEDTGMFLLRHTGNDKDFMSTRVSHVFDLTGPSINLQTACSTSLVALHYAAQALKSGDCDMAIAGGSTIELPHGRGYLFQENEILSPDGECHVFDHRAQGTVFGSGAGAVVLRRLKDAIADGDHIWAVIKGSAINNDGAAKAGYLAPSVTGQTDAIATAHAAAGVTADSIGYVECHGTGTYLGDPIEVSALTRAFRQTTAATGFCRIGSVKTNIGHLDTAAGVASLVKTALALHNREIPPSLSFEAPNPVIDFDTSPFKVADRLTAWDAANGPRRAAVNSLGVGGTNAHAVLQEAPEAPAPEASDWPFHVLTISARSRAALDANTDALAAHLRAHPEQPLADVAFTLKKGRRAFEHRRVVVADSHAKAADLLESRDPHRVFSHIALGDTPEVVFMFPGGGAQYPNMARDLYETEPVFRDWMDRGLAHLQPKLDYDVKALWLPEPGQAGDAAKKLKRPSVQLPLIMTTEYALAQLWMSWGVQPGALVGHSMGENTAACLAGVISFPDCIDLVLLRGQLFDSVPPGGMLSVPLSADQLVPYLGDDLDIAAINAPDLTAVSGPQAALLDLQEKLEAQDIACQRIAIDIAAHSRMLDPILERFRAFLAGIELAAPQIPFLSNRTGDFITDAQATDPVYWVEHLRQTVRFADCLATLSQTPNRVYLEVGPGKALAALAPMQTGITSNQVLGTLRHPDQRIADDLHFVGVIGRLWALGVYADWDQLWGDAKRRRVPLPTYAFQRSRYFIEPGQQRAEAETPLVRQDDIAKWGYRPVWRKRLAGFELDQDLATADPQTWLIFTDETGLGDRVAAQLRDIGHPVVQVHLGDAFARVGDDAYTLSPEQGRQGYDLLIGNLVTRGMAPTRIAHFWLVTGEHRFRPGSNFFDRNQECGFFSLLFLAQALDEADVAKPLHMTVVTNGAAQVQDETLPFPEKATIAGPCGVIPRELPGVTCATLDIELATPRRLGRWRKTAPATDAMPLARRLLEDLLAEPAISVTAYRGAARYEQEFRPLDLPAANDDAPAFRDQGVYLITGGFGGIGIAIAEQLANDFNARIVLLSRQPLPDRAEWSAYLLRHGPLDSTAQRIRDLKRLEALGAEIMVAVADVCNPDQMAQAIQAIRDRFGRIDGVLHAAGTVDDAPLLAKTTRQIEDVLAPKIQGTRVLDALFPDGSLDLVVLFASTSTLTTPAGQIDYVAANGFLNAFANARQGGKTRVMAINWGVWAEVGMAAKAVAGCMGTCAPLPSEPAGQPLLDKATFDAGGHRVFTTTLSTRSHWVLDQHRTAKGAALMPGTGYLELAAEALAAQGEAGAFEISDLYFFRPLAVADGKSRDMRVRLTRRDHGYEFETLSDCTVGGRNGFHPNAKGRLVPATAKPTPRIDIQAITARTTARIPADGQDPVSPQEAHLKFGPRWRVLKSIRFGDNEGLARLALPSAARRDLADGYLLHPALLDLATGWAVDLSASYDPQDLWVPVSYRRATVRSSLPAEIFSWVRSTPGEQPGFATFDVTICDASGSVCVEIEGFAMKQVAQADGLAIAPPIDPREVEFDDDRDPSRPATKAEARLAYQVSQGIRPEEGPQALIRALDTGLSQVVVSSLDLPALIRQAGESAETKPKQVFDRPAVDAEFIAPRNEIERNLAGFWQDLLGVSKVGVNDSFFDLGGHSLIAVRLFSRIRSTYQVDYPISVLFEAPTIAKCAAMIAERIGVTDTDAPAKPTQRHTHLVPMHEGEGGPGTPVFMVAGMFGNVLNLRHLALLLGKDRRFYGLQARGLLGDAEPHQDVAEAARDYIAEIRTVQPHGPYLIGGFSGGGITAYEMAQQLRRDGEEVAMLALLDTPLPVRPVLSRRDKALIKLQELRRKGPRFIAEWAASRIAWEMRKRAGPAATTDQPHFHDLEIEAAFRAAVADYDLQPWSGPVTLFRPALDRHWPVSKGQWVSREREYVFEDNQWRGWIPQLTIKEVSGDHDSMVLDPHVRVLAHHLMTCLDAAERHPAKPETQAPAWVPATAAE